MSPLQLRGKRFRRLKRGYYSFVLLVSFYALSFFLPLLMNHRAILVQYNGNFYFPAMASYLHDTFSLGQEKVYLAKTFDQTNRSGRPLFGEANYRELQLSFAEKGSGDFVIMPVIPYGPNESFLDLPGTPPHSPSRIHWMGTDDRARDVMVRLTYGFRISITFALLVTVVGYTIGIVVGAVLGYFGRWVDIVGQRFVEIWGNIPFLYTVIILASILGPSFGLLTIILAGFSWVSITYYLRGEFYREKSKDYVAAAIATGEGHLTIILRHILPNALTPIITFAPFAIVSLIISLVSLDFLGYGLPAPTPSWGELLKQAKVNLRVWHLVVFPLGAMFVTLQLVVFIGEAVREAFDPKVQSRLR
ncbi:MAG: peptide ABC transporter permease [Planctomycetaceae bacterium]|nr:peptide ABC transporter permease [Planctomycetaceae bacterium]MBP63827.1 peptide ABC transporter permease [Planctomycetaceae bacterium]